MSSDERLRTTQFNRPPRVQLPRLDGIEVEIPAPPPIPEIPEQNLLITILPVLGISVMAVLYVLRSATSGGSLLFALPMLLLSGLIIGGSVMAQRWRRRDYQRRQFLNELNYIRLLETKQAQLQAAADAQSALLQLNYPAPPELLNRTLSDNSRLWERRPEDADFGWVRIGEGRVPSAVTLRLPTIDTGGDLHDKALALGDQYAVLQDAPVTAALSSDQSFGLCGKRAHVLKAARALICQLAVAHAPQDLHIYLIAPKGQQEDWRWLGWLPHSSQSHRGGTAELVAFESDHVRGLIGQLGQIIDERKEGKSSHIPHLLIVIDGPELVEAEAVYSTILREGQRVGASALCLVGSFQDVPSDCNAVIEVEDDKSFRYLRVGVGGFETAGTLIDQLSVQDAEHIARALSAVMLHETGGAGRIPQRVEFLDMAGVRRADELRKHMAERWRRPIHEGVLPHRIPLGRESLAVATELMLDEDHHGPHGVLAGTTGSGKSELLQTMVCSMALEHDPRLLTLLLIDFKGGSTFSVFADLPHTVGMVTNLDGIHVQRTLEALRAETQWRQQFLKSMNVRDITQYHRYFAPTDDRVLNAGYKALPHLFIIVDEFAQLAKEMPEFLRELVRIAQVGRSLGLHLILGTQSPMDVITDEMNANLQFRICLRVQNIEASRAMLRRPDAAYLPAGWPGRGYLQVGERGVFKQFQTAYVGGDYERDIDDDAIDDDRVILELLTDSGQAINLLPVIHSSYPLLIAPQDAADNEPYTVAKAIVETVIRFAQEQGIPRMPTILLSPLENRMTLAQSFNAAGVYAAGWNGDTWWPLGVDNEGHPINPGSAPVGLLDDVYNRTQQPLWINLNVNGEQERGRKDGHVLVVGAPGTGKTMFLRTLAMSLALLHPPDAVNMYFLSFTGAGLDEVSRLPHAERVIVGIETERTRRLFGRLIKTLNERQLEPAKAFQPVIMLCIDQYEQFREVYRDTHLNDFERLLNEGRAVGIYLVITASSVSAVPDRIRAVVQQRIVFQLGTASDYTLIVGRIDAPLEHDLPPGRGYLYGSPPLISQISLPCNDETVSNEREALTQMTRRIDAMRQTSPQFPAPINELPSRVLLHSFVQPEISPELVTALGYNDDDGLSLFTLDWWAAGPHFVVTGPPGSGKTNLLQVAILSAAQSRSPQELRFVLVDFAQRSLRPLSALKHVIARVTNVVDLQTQLANLQSELEAFDMRGESETEYAEDGALLGKFPATVIVIDDYDATSEALSGHLDTLRQLRDHVRLHSDFGFYVWAAGDLERTADPLIKQLLLRRSGFGLMTRESLQKLNIRITGLPSEIMPEGRAFFPQQNSVQVVQIALVEDTPAYVKRINEQWDGHERAAWLNPARGVQVRRAAKPIEATGSMGELSIDTEGLIEDLFSQSDEQ